MCGEDGGGSVRMLGDSYMSSGRTCGCVWCVLISVGLRLDSVAGLCSVVLTKLCCPGSAHCAMRCCAVLCAHRALVFVHLVEADSAVVQRVSIGLV